MRNSNQDFLIKIMTGTVVMMMALLWTASLALAQGGTRVYLQPVDSDDSTMTVEVMAENVTDMYGAEFRLKYDPAVVSVQDATADQEGVQIESGTLLPADQGFVVANEVNETEGTITFAMTLLNPAPAVNGNGPLARVKFNILQESLSTIDVEHAKLVAVDLQTIPSETAILTIGDDTQAETAAVPSIPDAPLAADSDFPWWIVATIMIILGIVAIGGFVLLGGLNRSEVKATVPAGSAPPVTPAVTNKQSTQPTSRRPSAFK